MHQAQGKITPFFRRKELIWLKYSYLSYLFFYIVLIINSLNTLERAENMKAIFGQVQGHRRHVNGLHELTEILLISIIAVLCGAET